MPKVFERFFRAEQESGAAGCVSKQFEADELLGTVARLYAPQNGSPARP